MGYSDRVKIDSFIGLTFVEIINRQNQELIFVTDNGVKYKMFHEGDCCETVELNDICGDLDDLLNTPILKAEEVCSCENPEGIEIPEYQESFTWTFYKLATIKGYVDLRWYGESNGYYSESVEIEKIEVSNV